MLKGDAPVSDQYSVPLQERPVTKYGAYFFSCADKTSVVNPCYGVSRLHSSTKLRINK